MLTPIKEKLQKLLLRSSKIRRIVAQVREHFWFYLFCVLLALYLYGIAIHSLIRAMQNFTLGTAQKTLSLNPVACFAAVLTPQGLGVLFFLFVMYILISGKWIHLLTGVKITKDERNFFVTNEGTHGTSGWITKKERDRILVSGTADTLPCPILCKIKDSAYDDDRLAEYLGLRADARLNKHIMIYGVTGSGKSHGFVKPLLLKMTQLMQAGQKSSMVIVDPKAGATRF